MTAAKSIDFLRTAITTGSMVHDGRNAILTNDEIDYSDHVYYLRAQEYTFAAIEVKKRAIFSARQHLATVVTKVAHHFGQA